MYDMYVVGLCGEMGAGKNYIATNVVGKLIKEKFKTYEFIEIAFADFLKVECAINNPDIYTDFLKSTKTFQTRKILQEYGSKMRQNDTNYWVNKTKYFMMLQQSKFDKVVFCITDVRYENEIEFVKENNGLLVKIDAPNRTKNRQKQEEETRRTETDNLQQHESEKVIRELDNTNYDLIMYNDLDNDLYSKEYFEQLIKKKWDL